MKQFQAVFMVPQVALINAVDIKSAAHVAKSISGSFQSIPAPNGEHDPAAAYLHSVTEIKEDVTSTKNPLGPNNGPGGNIKRAA